MAAAAKPAKPAYELSGWERFKKDVVRDKWLYLLILPGMLFMLIFRYIPIFGNVIAFMDFNPYNMWNSTWVGFDQFIKLFNKPAFMQTFYNTLYISILKMVCGFPIPIILALMMNEMRNMQFKKVAQTLLYLPHFISWVVMAGQESIDDWDNYVATLNSLGLEDVLAEANEDYATLSAQMEEYLAAHGEA